MAGKATAGPDTAGGAVVLEGGPGLPGQLQVVGGDQAGFGLGGARGDGVGPVEDVVTEETAGGLGLGGAQGGEGGGELGVAARREVAAPLVGGQVGDGALPGPAPGGDRGLAVDVADRAEGAHRVMGVLVVPDGDEVVEAGQGGGGEEMGPAVQVQVVGEGGGARGPGEGDR